LVDYSLIQGDAQPDPGIRGEILVQLGKSLNKHIDQADYKTGLVHVTAGRQQGQSPVPLLLDFRGAGRHAGLPEGELEDVGESLLGRVLATRPAPAVVLNVVGDDYRS
jgi:hypothetical protein